MITSNPAICDHFKSGQRSRAQDMRLFYRAGAGSGKFCLSLSDASCSVPTNGEGAESSSFFLLRKVFVLGFGGVAGAKPPNVLPYSLPLAAAR